MKYSVHYYALITYLLFAIGYHKKLPGKGCYKKGKGSKELKIQNEVRNT